ncbi:MAG: sulfide/dihydroorotate dehydrogenase-like FAD/NAD-binding protein [Bacteroidales bacterium]|nr:sulfide/dihydroorotate dehydrogenase-like FAD/NAD-binding protein [Bacteroidales bacterium]MBD5217785.1 sulfide/dihydroorotate dehydrogenase-like FAD/NAD-binding protein [Bacteroidales bacterium]MBD5221686.1 sulfide/dihydroorotate dehydrogenase-like FAD/NAD-binding protein [Bacteroidales bacterium]
MYKIISKRTLAPNIVEMVVDAPRVAQGAEPGQFVIVRTDEMGERIPLTICDYDREKGTITIVTQAVGLSSRKIIDMEEGESFADFAGPLGRPSDLLELPEEELRKQRILFVAGGVGTAPVYPQVKWLKEHGVEADVVIGAKTKDIFTYVDEMRKVGNVYLCTDDGSEGFHGMVPALVRDLIDNQGKEYDRCVIIGPMIMMKFAAQATKEYGIPTIVSLNALMVDGTGMCGACRVSVGGKTLFTCVDGPEFDGHQVDFDEAMRRQAMYRDHKKSNPETHKCKCHNG